MISISLRAQDIKISSVSLPFESFTVGGMAEDAIGNLWLASTGNGLYKYDGTTFTHYANDVNDPNSLVSNGLECILIDRRGLIWIGSFTSGISVYNPSTDSFTNYSHDINDSQSIRSNGIRRFVEDDKGGIWIATIKGIDYWNPETQSFEHDLAPSTDTDILNEEHVRVLFIDNAGTLWAGSSSPFNDEQTQGGLFKIDPKTKSVKRYAQSENDNSLINNSVTAIFEDSRGTFWVGTAGDGLHTMERELGTFKRHTYDPSDPSKLSRSPQLQKYNYVQDHIRFIDEDSKGRVWIGTIHNGINLFDPNEGSMVHLSSDREDNYKLPIGDLWTSITTKGDIKWISGLIQDGELSLIKINLSPLDLNHVEIDMPIYSFAEDNNGDVYIGTDNALAKIEADGTASNVFSLQSDDRYTFYHINKDSDGIFWISTQLGFLRFDPYTLDHRLFKLPQKDDIIESSLAVRMTDDISTDSILVASRSGLYLFDLNDESFTSINYNFTQATETADVYPSMIFIDSRDIIWLRIGFGLTRLSSDLKTFNRYTFLENVQDILLDMYEDDTNTLYVGNSRSGLRKYVPEQDTFLLLTDEKGLLNEESGVGGITKVNDSTLWLSSNSGLMEFDLNNHSAVILDIKEINDYEFTSEDFFTASSGDSYLGTSTGYLKYRIDDFRNNESYNPVPSISKITVDNKNLTTAILSSTNNYRLNHNKNNISITLNYINFMSNSGDRKLECRLDDYDLDWRTWQNDDELDYFKLPADSYVFRYRASSSNGEWVEDSIQFTVLPPWWKTLWAYMLYLISFVILGRVLFNAQKRRTIRMEREKTRDRELSQAKEIEKAYAELKATQAQLIQSEKMASLGELTAGIAHEIQNPLNFVNNFSEVSAELIDEMNEEIAKGDLEEVKSISADLKQNLEKIAHHGVRASGIVKGMLQHSRSGSGEIVSTDINALADEYLRLAYHGLRAKDSSFNATMNTDFDKSIGLLNIVPQDISRVILNIITNAFHACQERARQIKEDVTSDDSYQPTVTLSTVKRNGNVEIHVNDNGHGIPEEIKNKIFEPFFTTKATGQGTGLGLSLAYDIIKAHGGKLEVESEVGVGTTFIIILQSE